MPEKLLFDRLIEECRRELRGKKQPSSVQVEPRVTTIDELRKQLYEKHKKRKNLQTTIDILGESNLFLLNGAVVDDLYHLPPEYTDYESLSFLPFPVLFFEFMDSLRIERSTGYGNLKGMLFGKASQTNIQLRGIHDDAVKDTFSVSLFYEDDHITIEELFIGPEDFGNQRPGYTAIKVGEENKHINLPDVTSYTNLFNLCVNIIAYINAHNVIINSVDRNKKDLGVINKKRERKGKKPIKPLAPYHWVEIRQCEVNGTKEREGLTLDYRERVRGHFQRYNTVKGQVRKWIMSYERGPEDAPWKENRYKVLDDMQRRGNRLQNGS